MIEKARKLIDVLLKEDILLSPDFIEDLQKIETVYEIEKLIEKKIPKKEIEGIDLTFLKEKEIEKKVKILFDFEEEQTKKQVKDFVSYFTKRYKIIEGILSKRQELSNILSISRIKQKKEEKETVSVVGIVMKKETTKNGNLMITLEDPTGNIKILINKTKKKIFEQALDLVPDEIIGILGVTGNNIIFVNNVIWPDVPLTKELKKSPDEAYAVFTSDIHIGSKEFLEKEFLKLISWLNGNLGTIEQKRIVKKVKYLFIVGDLVDGVGIYPGQENDLKIPDIYNQYEKAAEFLKKIPKEITIIICPGNHDAMRITEPQPKLYEDYAKTLYEMENVILLSNPSYVNIHSSETFPGFDVLLYHGYSFDFYAQEVESIRNNGGYDRSDLIMEFLLKRRHLAPTHKSTLYLPIKEYDPLVIQKVPDIFATGHIHKCSVANYHNVTTICGSCFQAKTAFQEKVGHHPEPSRVPVVNLQTRNVKIMKFGD